MLPLLGVSVTFWTKVRGSTVEPVHIKPQRKTVRDLPDVVSATGGSRKRENSGELGG